jgi:hypothetical protein
MTVKIPARIRLHLRFKRMTQSLHLKFTQVLSPSIMHLFPLQLLNMHHTRICSVVSLTGWFVREMEAFSLLHILGWPQPMVTHAEM